MLNIVMPMAGRGKRFADAGFKDPKPLIPLHGRPMVAVMLASRWFFYFFTVEKCFGAPLHFGMTPKQAVGEFIHLLRFGLLPRTAGEGLPSMKRSSAGKPPARKTTTARSIGTKRGKS